MPSLENWDGGLKVNHLSPHTQVPYFRIQTQVNTTAPRLENIDTPTLYIHKQTCKASKLESKMDIHVNSVQIYHVQSLTSSLLTCVLYITLQVHRPVLYISPHIHISLPGGTHKVLLYSLTCHFPLLPSRHQILRNGRGSEGGRSLGKTLISRT